MQLTHEMLAKLEALEQKYTATGQDIKSYLDGLLYADYLTYWNYIHLDTLLSLQNPKTSIPDERIFIIYHQITELYFRLILDAMEQAANQEELTGAFLLRQVKRVNRYFKQLIDSFDIMVAGMDKEEFLKYRMSLLPASGFQSVQYRMIELLSTDAINLVHHTKRDEITPKTKTTKLYSLLYWKWGATELATGRITLTLKQFEEKYAKHLSELTEIFKDKNIRKLYLKLSEEEQQNPELIAELREHDLNANVRWNLAHLRSAMKYLDNKPKVIAATGGTNWQEYLPPKNQRIIFYPELWSDDELDTWGTRAFKD